MKESPKLSQEEAISRVRAWFGDTVIVEADEKGISIRTNWHGSIVHENGLPSRDDYLQEIDGLCESLLNSLNYAHVSNHFPHLPGDMTLKDRLKRIRDDLVTWERWVK